MRLTKLTTGLAFKSALWACAAFLVVCAVAGFVLVRSVENALIAELTSQAQSEATLLSEIYEETDEAGLIEALRVTSQTTQHTERFAGLMGVDGASLIGPVSTPPDFVGTRRLNMGSLTVAEISGGYVVHVRRIDQRTLVVGRNDTPVRTARARLTIGLVGFAICISLVMLGLGLWASQLSLRRLNDMDHVLYMVGEGDLSARLPILGRKDQFDQVSDKMNKNLDHLERSVASMKAAASAIAHDLKTPLGHVQIALQAAEDATRRGQDPVPHIEEALQETEGLNSIFEAVLRISRIRAGGEKRNFGPVSLDDLAQKAVDFLGPLAEQNDQDLSITTTNPAPVSGDQAMLQQAIINLVQNAVVHAGTGARINIRLAENVIEVRDTGPGAPKYDLEWLLEPFYRADSTRQSEGSGLGLALVNVVAERHGATVTLRNLEQGFSVAMTFGEPNFKKY